MVWPCMPAIAFAIDEPTIRTSTDAESSQNR
jgi:hypothetical protein